MAYSAWMHVGLYLGEGLMEFYVARKHYERKSPKLHALRPQSGITGCGLHKKADVVPPEKLTPIICGSCRQYWMRFHNVDIEQLWRDQHV